jgi:hypothetical protein
MLFVPFDSSADILTADEHLLQVGERLRSQGVIPVNERGTVTFDKQQFYYSILNTDPGRFIYLAAIRNGYYLVIHIGGSEKDQPGVMNELKRILRFE